MIGHFLNFLSIGRYHWPTETNFIFKILTLIWILR